MRSAYNTKIFEVVCSRLCSEIFKGHSSPNFVLRVLAPPTHIIMSPCISIRAWYRYIALAIKQYYS